MSSEGSLGSRPGDLTPEDHLAVQQVLSRYAYAIDEFDLDLLAGVLTEDCSWAFQHAERSAAQVVEGRSAIIEFVAAAHAGNPEPRRHNLANITAHSTPEGTALARAYLMLISIHGGTSRLQTTGAYEFRLKRSVHGWQIDTLTLSLDSDPAR